MTKRRYYFDYLRVLGSLAVVLLHCSTEGWNWMTVGLSEWNALNLYESISRWGVPVFLMISGALFLSRNIDIKTLFKKYILHLFIVFYSWSFLYALVNYFQNRDLLNAFYAFLNGYNHQWYLLLAIGLYIATPILKKITEDKKVCEYFIIVSFVFSFTLLTVCRVLSKLCLPNPNAFFFNMNLWNVPGYFCYYVLGYYLDQYEIRYEKLIYVLGLIGLFVTFYGSYKLSVVFFEANSLFYGNDTPNVFFTSVAIFLLFKNRFNKENKVIEKISKYTLCIYMVHPLIIGILDKIGINSKMCHPIIAIPIVLILTYFISTIIAIIVKKIPILRKCC